MKCWVLCWIPLVNKATFCQHVRYLPYQLIWGGFRKHLQKITEEGGSDNPYDIPYLYGSSTMSTRGRILLASDQLPLTNVNTLVRVLSINTTTVSDLCVMR